MKTLIVIAFGIVTVPLVLLTLALALATGVVGISVFAMVLLMEYLLETINGSYLSQD